VFIRPLGATSAFGDEAAADHASQVALFERLRTDCSPGDVKAWIELADWAQTIGLIDEADELYRLALDHDPLNDRAFSALTELSMRRGPQRLSEAYEDARELLPARFVVHETPAFIVLSDVDARWTRTQIRRLERTRHQFRRFAGRLGLRAQPQRCKLVCVFFSDRDEYQQFAREHDDVADPWIAGYYAPVNDRIVFYRGEANPSVVEARRKLDEMQAEIDAIGEEASRASVLGNHEQAVALREQRRKSQAHVNRERDRVDAFAEQVNVATTTHEAAHQLLFHCRVQSPHAQYPIWISEGLATAFETDDPDKPFGPDRDFAPRREAFEELLADDDLIPLRRLVSWANVPSSRQRVVHAVYHQSYALVTWMSRFRKDELRRFFELMLVEDVHEPDGDRYVELFESAFGDLDRLERAWLRYEKGRLND
jgi:hypothetical protein